MTTAFQVANLGITTRQARTHLSAMTPSSRSWASSNAGRYGCRTSVPGVRIASAQTITPHSETVGTETPENLASVRRLLSAPASGGWR